jgi:hypothetical protein
MAGLASLAPGCGSGSLTGHGPPDAGSPVDRGRPPDAGSPPDGGRLPDNGSPPDAGSGRAVDILFMIDDSSEMTAMQQKLVGQLATFVLALQNLPGGLPDLHIAVVSSDLGAPGDSSAAIGCTASGDEGAFQSAPRGSCAASGLQPGATFISNAGGVANYTGDLADVLACIVPLGSNGCGFEHQLASVARALGAGGAPPPPGNAGFLRPDALLAIFLLTNEDDCSAPADTTLYSLNGWPQGVTNPLGPIANYRCNQFGHLCRDPSGPQPEALLPPPLAVPSDATGDPPALALTACVSNDGAGAMLTPVAAFVREIQALKSDPSRIVTAAVIGPPTPYTVTWWPPANPPPNPPGQFWPQVMHSCGARGGDLTPAGQVAADGSFGDPGVRVGQWVQAFGGATSSVCDASYTALGELASEIGRRLAAP